MIGLIAQRNKHMPLMKSTNSPALALSARRPSLRFAFLLSALWLFAEWFPVDAGTHTWTGAGITGNWSLPANWQGNNPPTAGEAAPVTLSFPKGALRLHNTNNIAGLTVHGITVAGAG